jgi:hypothetical protein
VRRISDKTGVKLVVTDGKSKKVVITDGMLHRFVAAALPAPYHFQAPRPTDREIPKLFPLQAANAGESPATATATKARRLPINFCATFHSKSGANVAETDRESKK